MDLENRVQLTRVFLVHSEGGLLWCSRCRIYR